MAEGLAVKSALAAFLLAGCASNASAPPQTVAAIFEGVGLAFSPGDVSARCESGVCTVSLQGEGIRWEVSVPRDLRNYGSGCALSGPSLDPFRTNGAFDVAESSISLTYAGSPECPERKVVERFVKTDVRDATAAQSYITNVVGLWRACVLTANDAYQCAPSQRYIAEGSNAGRVQQIGAWLAE